MRPYRRCERSGRRGTTRGGVFPGVPGATRRTKSTLATAPAPRDGDRSRRPAGRPAQDLRRGRGRRRRVARDPRRRVLLAPRAVGLRQDHHPADDRRLRAPDRRPDPAPRPGHHPRAARAAPGQHGLPELRALPAPDGVRERRLRAAAARDGQGGGHPPRRAPRWSSSTCPTSGSASRTSSRAASSSASRWPARSCASRPCCCSTSRSGALDLKLRRQLQVELKRVQLEVGITFIYVTHDQEEALALSDRIAVMDHGRVEQLGTPEELYDAPRTRFVAGFIGTTNLLAGDGRVRGRPARSWCGWTAASAAWPRRGWPRATAVDLAIRPEAMELGHSRPPVGRCAGSRRNAVTGPARPRPAERLPRDVGEPPGPDATAALVLTVVVPRTAERRSPGRPGPARLAIRATRSCSARDQDAAQTQTRRRYGHERASIEAVGRGAR